MSRVLGSTWLPSSCAESKRATSGCVQVPSPLATDSQASSAAPCRLRSAEKVRRITPSGRRAGDALPLLGSTRRHKIWDHVAGVALVLAAGGLATDLDGSPLLFTDGNNMPNQGMIVTSGVYHDALVSATQALLKEESQSS